MKKLMKQVLDWCGLGMGWVWDGYGMGMMT